MASSQATAYDSKPEMSAFKVTDKVLRAIDDGETDVYVVNFANADMVGHTGNLKAAIEAVESLDTCLGWVVGTVERVKGAAIITSDHGNCEQMILADRRGAAYSPHDQPGPLHPLRPRIQRDFARRRLARRHRADNVRIARHRKTA